MGDSPREKPGVLEYKFPEVLLRSPRCLIALSGLDVLNNAIHRLVWDEFSSGRRTDRKPILFKNFPADHLYPKCGADVSLCLCNGGGGGQANKQHSIAPTGCGV